MGEMKIEGTLKKAKNYWAASVPLLLVHTQGKSKKEACLMAKDAIESLVECKGFEVSVSMETSSTFTVQSNDEAKLIAFALKQQRNHYGLSVRDVVARMGLKSPTSYSQYETGKVNPTLEKISRLFYAINNDLEIILKIK